MRTILHKSHVLGPNGQYFVKTPSNVIGIVSRQRAESATAKVAMKIFLAVRIPKKQNERHYQVHILKNVEIIIKSS